MQTPRATRSSVLGKRSHPQHDSSLSMSPPRACDQLQTPDPTPNPKRVRTSISSLDPDSNKENVPPYTTEHVNLDSSPSTARVTRSLRRNATEAITPTRPRTAPRRHASTSIIPATPTAEISHLNLFTPPTSPPISLLPIHARVRALLRATCNSTDAQIAGRDVEGATIRGFLGSFIDKFAIEEDEPSSGLYISGSPGTGKTALVNSILRTVDTEASGVKVISINCMALNGVDSLWERLLEEIDEGAERASAGRLKKRAKGRIAVEAKLSGLRTKCIVILDELDHITPNSQSLTSLFSLPVAKSSSLRLIGIANTHTLTSSSISTVFSPSANVRTLHFAPYTPPQLLEILQSRLSTLYEGDVTADGSPSGEVKKFLPPPTLMLLTKKVAALTGDVRSLFEVLRSAIDLAVSSPKSASQASAEDHNPLNTPSATVTPTHILAALKAYTPSSVITTKAAPHTSSQVTYGTGNSEIMSKIQNLGLQARLVLLSVLLASKRLEAGLSLSMSASILASPRKMAASPVKRTSSLNSAAGVGIESTQLHTYYSSILTRGDTGVFDPVSRSEFGDLIGVLEGVGLIALSSSVLAPGSLSPAGGAKAKRAFGRSASFASGIGKGKGGAGEVRLGKGVWGDEVLRGLGVAADAVPGDVRAEEVRSIWEKEKARLGRDIKSIENAISAASKKADGVFEAAFED